MFWDKFVDLCSENGTSPNAVAAQLGKSSGSVTAWKNGAVPRETTLKKIADYFSVTVDQLLYETDNKKSPASEDAELDPLRKKAWDLMNSMDTETLRKFVSMCEIFLGGASDE